MKEKLIIIVFFICQINFSQNNYKLGSFEIYNDAVYNTSINSGNIAGINMGFDGANGFVKFGAHTGNGYRGDILYMRGSDGNVGIGTANPDSKLTVTGNIHAREIKVTVNAGVIPDYVFANDYKLKSLQEVENFIKEHNHLPEIPSAQEMEKNGLMLAEMNLNLLKKIEEMTLYMIEQEKKINQQSLQIETLRKENNSFKSILERLSKIEQKIK